MKLLVSTGLLVLLVFTQCGRGGRGNGNYDVNDYYPISNEEPAFTKMSFYLENSMSMDGYVVPGGNLVENCNSLLNNTLSVVKSDTNIRLFTCANETIEYHDGLTAFQSLLKEGVPEIGKRNTSNIPSMIKNLITNFENSEVRVLVSDFIFSSIEKGSDEEKIWKHEVDLQNFSQQLQNEIGAELKQNNLSVWVFQFESLFEGTYYPVAGGKEPNFNAIRPYYMMFVGSETSLSRAFDNEIDITSYEGYLNHVKLTPTNYDVNYTVLPYGLGSKGEYYTDRNTGARIDEITFGDFDRDDQFGFSIAVDLSELPIDQDYISNVTNYIVVSDGYSLDDVIKVNDLFENGQTSQEEEQVKLALGETLPNTYTHILSVSSEKPIGTVEVSLSYPQFPSWVQETWSDSDSIENETKNGKTFGFSTMMNAISKAYSTDELFEISVIIKK